MSDDTNLTAPIGSVDLFAFDDDGEAFAIHPCPECLPWHAEVVIDPETEVIMIREWHAVGCSLFQSLIEPDERGRQDSR